MMPIEVGSVFAMAASPEGGSPWLQLIPFVLVLGIFYFHHPAADEKETAESAAVPREPESWRSRHYDRRHSRAGDTARRTEHPAADRRQGRIDVSRAAIGGLQGQAPVVDPETAADSK